MREIGIGEPLPLEVYIPRDIMELVHDLAPGTVRRYPGAQLLLKDTSPLASFGGGAAALGLMGDMLRPIMGPVVVWLLVGVIDVVGVFGGVFVVLGW